MADLENRQIGTEHRASRNPQHLRDASPVRVFVLGAILIVAIVAGLLTVIRVFLFPVWEANSEGARQVATAQAQLSLAMTQEALTPVATATLTTAATVQPTAELAAVQTAVPAIAAQETPAPSLPVVETAPSSAATPGTLPTPTAEQAADIASAYKKYFDVSTEALLNLDANSLDDVAAGPELRALQQDIDDDRTHGRALQTNVQHDQVYVLNVQGDEADIADRYTDSSIYVNPETHEPLPGQVAPASPDVAPAVSVIYHLQRIDGTWKVVSGQRFVPQSSQ